MKTGSGCSISETARIAESVKIGNHVTIGDEAIVGEHVTICDGTIIAAGSVVEENVYLDFGVILRENTRIGEGSFIGARCIVGEYLADFMKDRIPPRYETIIGRGSILRSETIVYGKNVLGEALQTGHRVTIREESKIGHHVRIGTLSDIQGYCRIGDYVNLHSNVHIGQKSVIKDYVWIFPYVVLTNDPNPPSEHLMGVTVDEFAVIATGSIILPGVHIGTHALIGAASLVNKDVQAHKVAVGNPSREVAEIESIRHKGTGEPVYPWPQYFDRGMPWSGIGYEEWRKSHLK